MTQRQSVHDGMPASQQNSQARKWVVWSTRETIDNDVPSAISIAETVLAVCVYGWIANEYETYLPLLISAAVAPLVLLRSDKSVALGVKWFIGWERNLTLANKSIGKHNHPMTYVALFGIILLLLPLYYTVAHRALVEAEGWTAFWRSFVLVWLSGALLSAIGTIGRGWGRMDLVRMLAGNWTWIGPIATMVAGATAAAVVGAIVGLVIPIIGATNLISPQRIRQVLNAPLPIGGRAETLAYEATSELIKYKSLTHNIVLLPLLFGHAVGVFVVSIIVRIAATTRFLYLGVQALPRNFWRLALCTSPKQVPELVPGLAAGETAFSLDSMWSEFGGKYKSGTRLAKFAVMLVYLPVMVLWFVPAWIYRVSLKGTAWLWWPLAVLMSPPKLAKNPDWFHAQVMETRWSRNMRVFAYFSIVAFLTVSLWRTFSEGTQPDNPFLNALGYALSIDWVSTPWQLLGVTGALLSLAIVYLVDWDFRKYRIAVDTRDVALADEAMRHFGWIERLARVRSMLFIAYCAIVAFHAVLVFNHQACLFTPTQSLQSWSKTLYGDRTPSAECIKSKLRT